MTVAEMIQKLLQYPPGVVQEHKVKVVYNVDGNCKLELL